MRLKARLLTVILAWFTIGGACAATAVEVPMVRDFTQEARAAEAAKVPILILFSRPGCPYCEQILREFLLPMQRNPEYRTKVIMRQIQVDGRAPLRDFAGKPVTHGQFARGQHIQLVPTIKLFDARGQELTEPLIGLTTPDYFGGFLDQRIDEALGKVRSQK